MDDGLVLLLEAGGEQWGCPASQVNRTLLLPLAETPLPWLALPAEASRYDLQAVIHLSRWWGLPAHADTPSPTMRPIVLARQVALGIAADRIIGLRRLPLNAIQPPPPLLRAPLEALGCTGVLPPTTEAEPFTWILNLPALLRAALNQMALLERPV